MDETGLFWKATLDKSLIVGRLSGRKAKKARITIIHCCNADGSDKLPLWIIGKTARPRIFGYNQTAINSLPIVYKSNAKAWVNTVLATQWLEAFARHTKQLGRKVLLLWDNHSAHEAALREYIQHPLTPLSTKPHGEQGTVHAQIVRSSGDWSSGILTEHSIQNACGSFSPSLNIYHALTVVDVDIQMIREANHYIYIGLSCLHFTFSFRYS